MAEDEKTGISADEVALYDRQIRLWGMEAQARMRNSHILLVGLNGIANEAAKNLVLAGVGALTIIDNEVVKGEHLAAQFFVTEADIGKPRAEAAAAQVQALNPRVKLTTLNENIKDKSAEWFETFSIAIAVDQELDTLLYINSACRKANCPFYAAGSFGLFGYVFVDLIKHTFVIERDKSNINTAIAQETKTRKVVDVKVKREGGQTKEFITKEESYLPLSEVLEAPIDPSWRIKKKRTVPGALPAIYACWQFFKQTGHRPKYVTEDIREFTKLAEAASTRLGLPSQHLQSSFLASFLQNCTAEIAPVCAILGGVLAQDVINVLGKREQPIQNFFVFDGDATAAPILCLIPPAEENGVAEKPTASMPAGEAVVLD